MNEEFSELPAQCYYVEFDKCVSFQFTNWTLKLIYINMTAWKVNKFVFWWVQFLQVTTKLYVPNHLVWCFVIADFAMIEKDSWQKKIIVSNEQITNTLDLWYYIYIFIILLKYTERGSSQNEMSLFKKIIGKIERETKRPFWWCMVAIY